MIITDIILILLGLIGLFFGGDFLVKGASRIAASLGIEPLVIGLTIVAFGTSTPELLVNISAALQGSTDISIGNVIGSNVSNIGLVLGMTGFIFPIMVKTGLVQREIPILIGVSVFVYIIAFNGEISQMEGLLLLTGFFVFNGFMYWQTQRARTRGEMNHEDDAQSDIEGDVEVNPEAVNRALEAGRVVVGIAVLMLGARFMVDGATSIARDFGVSEFVIGASLVAVGTSLPELSASVVAALRRQSDIAIGNVIGSNIANLLVVLGPTAMVAPMPVPDNVLQFQFPALLVFTWLLLPFSLNMILSRRESLVYLAGYAGFIILTFIL